MTIVKNVIILRLLLMNLKKIEGNFGEIEYYGDYIIRCKYRGNMQRFIKNY